LPSKPKLNIMAKAKSNRKQIQDILDTFDASMVVGEIASNSEIRYHRYDTLIDQCFEKQVWAIYTGYSNPCIWGTAEEVMESLREEQGQYEICEEASK